jgi:hypothetical protein
VAHRAAAVGTVHRMVLPGDDATTPETLVGRLLVRVVVYVLHVYIESAGGPYALTEPDAPDPRQLSG